MSEVKADGIILRAEGISKSFGPTKALVRHLASHMEIPKTKTAMSRTAGSIFLYMFQMLPASLAIRMTVPSAALLA